LLTLIISFVSTKGTLSDLRYKRNWKKIVTPRGWWVLGLTMLIVALLLWQNKIITESEVKKNAKIDTLAAQADRLKNLVETNNQRRNEKRRLIAQQSLAIFAAGNLFYDNFITRYGGSELCSQMKNDIKNGKLTDQQIVSKIKPLFLSITMLEASNIMFNTNTTPLSHLQFYHRQMAIVNSAVNSILNQYGNMDDVLIKQLNEMGNRSKTNYNLTTFLLTQNRAEQILKAGVNDQYAEFFSYYYLCQHKCEILCGNIIAGD